MAEPHDQEQGWKAEFAGQVKYAKIFSTGCKRLKAQDSGTGSCRSVVRMARATTLYLLMEKRQCKDHDSFAKENISRENHH